MTMLTQTVTVPASATTSGEFIISVINTDNLVGIIIDSVSISSTILPPPTITSIYDLQYTVDASGNSPEAGNVVTTSGIVTGVIALVVMLIASLFRMVTVHGMEFTFTKTHILLHLEIALM
ncbi:MAG: hypothetical protein IPG07_10680 [Crocinitomicaceae bacterium]|nr:hypothetical protein [Crocinitomicaceae bacterium]